MPPRFTNFEVPIFSRITNGSSRIWVSTQSRGPIVLHWIVHTRQGLLCDASCILLCGCVRTICTTYPPFYTGRRTLCFARSHSGPNMKAKLIFQSRGYGRSDNNRRRSISCRRHD
ncbi:hypothetical protein BS47DRAFT_110804 [Hydnum rufescens UP504]|uniref:Uncharacterized protein n=1 Tax=Hydnum rufescens UP504 TaxID=1448309 RepID=A0A9P6AQF5_9AGAM|nr:hypothetical protein BS47DRAFT_110804 [Hydnum rufescens UP504]